jgi:diketogulonate reductase-like aldo/keto reductase
MKFDGPVNIFTRSAGKPPFIYGTAWKKDETRRLVKEAIGAGFTALDTAAQPRHYREELVGQALRDVYATGKITRNQLYLQTKYTPPGGQDRTDMPYDPQASLEMQIQSSIMSSLQNLRPHESLDSEKEAYIDCFILHSPLPTVEQTIRAWKVMESYVPSKIKSLGISNTDLPVLQAVFEAAKVKPKVVQNRFYGATNYDVLLRRFCRDNNIVYESFWTLTGSPKILSSELVRQLSQLAGVSREVAMYCLVIELGGTAPLNGTTNIEHMKQDLQDVARVKDWSSTYGDKWNNIVSGFRSLIGEE